MVTFDGDVGIVFVEVYNYLSELDIFSVNYLSDLDILARFFCRIWIFKLYLPLKIKCL